MIFLQHFIANEKTPHQHPVHSCSVLNNIPDRLQQSLAQPCFPQLIPSLQPKKDVLKNIIHFSEYWLILD